MPYWTRSPGLALMVLCSLVLASAAAASPESLYIDFRSRKFEPATGERTFSMTTSDGLDVSIEAVDPAAGSLGAEPEIYWDIDRKDGLGVGSLAGGEADEIEGLQKLVITFPGVHKLVLDQILITDLYQGSTGPPEHGYYLLDDGDPYTDAVRFDASCSVPECLFRDPENGELLLEVPGRPTISKITFFVDNEIAGRPDPDAFGDVFGLGSEQSGYDPSLDFDGDSVISAADFNMLRSGFSTAAIDPFAPVSEFSVGGLHGVHAPEPAASVVFAGSLIVVSYTLRRRRGLAIAR